MTSALCNDCLSFTVDHEVYGYGYNAQDTTTQLAIAVMVIYCIVAFAHIMYLCAFGISNAAWSSTGEMIALAMNSTPTRHLQNTCAGITGTKTYQIFVRIVAMGTGDTQVDHLELAFGNVKQEDVRRVEMNQKYGKIHLE